ncbi:hypothetical protein Tco_1403695 [Tanacetum coccineum]
MVQKPRSRRTRFGGDGVAVKFGGGGCGGWWRDSGICVMVERWRRGDEGGVEMVVWPRWRRVAWWQQWKCRTEGGCWLRDDGSR